MTGLKRSRIHLQLRFHDGVFWLDAGTIIEWQKKEQGRLKKELTS